MNGSGSAKSSIEGPIRIPARISRTTTGTTRRLLRRPDTSAARAATATMARKDSLSTLTMAPPAYARCD